jgi:hypothetical protein
VDDALDETLTAVQNAERRTLWTREQVFGMLRLQRRDDAAVVRSHVKAPGHCAACDMANIIADEIDPTERTEP